MSQTTAYAKPSPNVSVFVRVDMPDTADAVELDLFAGQYDAWCLEMVEHAKRFKTPFYASELRSLARYEPASASDWGKLFSRLKRAGFVQTGKYRKHPRESRKGGVEFEYTQGAI